MRTCLFIYVVFAGICFLIVKADILSDSWEEKLRGVWHPLLGPGSILLIVLLWISFSFQIKELNDKIDKLASAENEGDRETGEKKETSE